MHNPYPIDLLLHTQAYMYQTLLSVAFLGLLLWTWRILNWLWFRPKKLEKLLQHQGFHGNSYRLLHGDSKDMYSMAKEARSKSIKLSDDILPRILPFYYETIKKYGKKSFTWMGPVPRLCIMDPKMISEILVKNDVFRKIDHNPIQNLVVTGLSNYENKKWAKHRKIVTPAFHMERMKDMLPTMVSSCREMMEEWEKLVLENDSCEVDVWPHLQTLARDVISRTAFGSSFEEGCEIFKLQRQQAELAHHVLQYLYIPGWRFIPTKRMKRMREIFSEVQDRVKGIIENKEKNISSREANDTDLLGMMLRYNQEEIKGQGNNKNAGLSYEDIIEECKLFYFAGQESTANLLLWTIVLLAMHPEWQVEARAEVFRVFGNNVPDSDGLNRLKIVTMILQETLRLYPPGPIITRSTHQEVKLDNNTTLPAGVQLLLPIVLVHHDPELWGEDAHEFKPERFSEGVAKATKNQLCYFPFSWGPRTCVGNNFAMMEAKLVISIILQRFSFELSPSYSHAPFYIATLKPQHGAHVILRKV